MSATDQFTENPVLTAIAIGYRNPDQVMIADEALPRVPAPARNFSFTVYDEAEAFTVPNTHVGRRGTPNRVELEGSQGKGECEDYGIDIPLDNATIDEAKKNKVNPENRATERATDIVMLDREIRVASIITDVNNYHNDHVEVLGAGDRLTDPESDPISMIEDMMDTCWIRPNQLIFSFDSWRAIRKHPRVLKAVHGNLGDEGRASKAQIMELLEISRIIIGAARHNLKKPGENAELVRTWENTISGQFIDRNADPATGGVTFGFTAQLGSKVAGTLPANMGLRGGKLVRSGETLTEEIVAKRAGFLIKGAVKAAA